MKTRIFTLLFAVMAGMVTMNAEIYYGTCGANGDGSNILWTFNIETGALVLKGTGKMADYSDHTSVPWYEYRLFIESVELKSGITNIGVNAFYECKNLTSVILPEGLLSIGEAAFALCTKLATISLPNSLTTIQQGAFNYCNSLTSMYIPANVSSVAPDAFLVSIVYDVSSRLPFIKTNFTHIDVDPANMYFASKDGILYNKEMTKLIVYPAGKEGKFVVPNGVQEIGSFVFYGNMSLTEIEIPLSVTTIGEWAFGYCANLKSLTLPSSIKKIGVCAIAVLLPFVTCEAVNPPTMYSELTDDRGLGFGNLYDENNNKISQILYVPANSVEAYKAAEGWKDIPNILPIPGTEPACLKASGTCGAEGDNLTWTLSCDSVLTISGTGAMYEYYWNTPWMEYKDEVRYVIVEEGVTTIGATAFRDFIHLRQCSLPSTLISIGEEAFCFCFQLMSVDIPQSCTTISGWGAFNLVPNVNIQDESIAKNCAARSINGYVEGYFVYADKSKRSLRACSSIAKGYVALDDAIERIEYMAFAQCEEITNLQFGSHLQYIGEWSLNGCIGLEGLRFQEGLKEIASNAFGNCFGLQYVYLPNSLTTLGDFAIGNCPVLRTIHLGDSLRNVGSQIFDSCQGIDTIYATMTTPPVLDNTAFAASNLPGITCYVPKASLSLYQQAPVWSSMNLKAIGSFDPEPCLIASGTCGDNLTWELSCDSVLTISGTGAMTSAPWKESYKMAIKNAIIEDGVTNVLWTAFYECFNLKSVTIGNGVTQIEGNAFYDCSGLSNVTIGNNVISIGNSAFYGCSALTAISLPNSLTTIGNWAFSNCRVLTSVTIPQNVATIGQAAFGGCFNLTEINVVTENSNFCSVDGVLFNKNVTTLVQYPGGGQVDYIIPNSVTAVAAGAFWCCRNLTSIKIPSGVTTIGDWGFDACSGLTSITCEAVIPPTCGADVFYDVDKSIPVYVHAESVNAYKSASYWSAFTNIRPICESDNTIRTVSACSGYWFNDEWLEQSGIYHDTLLNHLGCDSIIELHLTIHSSYGGGVPSDLIDTITIVKGDPVIISNGITIYPSETGYQNDTLRTIYGCDSIVTHYIIVTEPKFSVIFLDYNSNVLSEQKVENGKAAQAPQVPTREGYTFVGWNVDIEHIVARTFAIALYDKIGGTLTYLSEEGDVIATENVDLHLPAAPIIAGKSFKGWLTESADAENGIVLRATYTSDNPTTHDDVTITPSSNSAYVIFPFITGALTYQLVIRDLFGNVVCKIMFSATGHLLGVAFAPSRNRTQQQATETTGFNFTVEGLDANTTYEYEFVANDETDEVIETLSGSFTTTNESSTEDNEQVNSHSAVRKYLEDGHLMIDANSHIFDTQGKMMK